MIWQDRLSLGGKHTVGHPRLRFVLSRKCRFHLDFGLGTIQTTARSMIRALEAHFLAGIPVADQGGRRHNCRGCRHMDRL